MTNSYNSYNNQLFYKVKHILYQLIINFVKKYIGIKIVFIY